jgi:hypothetical protein
VSKSIVIIILCLVISALAFFWLKYLDNKYEHYSLVESIDFSQQGNQSWLFTTKASEDFDLVIRFYKKSPPPYDYVLDIWKEGKFKGATLNVSWKLSNDGTLENTGEHNNYGEHFAATDDYIEKGIGKLSLLSGVDYLLTLNFPTDEKEFNKLEPEIRVTQSVETRDWLFSQSLINSFIILISLAISVITLIYYLVKR